MPISKPANMETEFEEAKEINWPEGGSSPEAPINQSRLIAFMDRMVQTKKATAVGQKSSCLREADYEQPVAHQSEGACFLKRGRGISRWRRSTRRLAGGQAQSTQRFRRRDRRGFYPVARIFSGDIFVP